MIFWYTGQPGHGKTLSAIEHAMQFKDKGRLVYVCNVREFDYKKTGMNEMTPEQFKDWMNFLPDGAVALVDEAYEHGMLPKRAPGSKVPPHVEQLAKHRHRGIDFIFVCQSPATQVDAFVHDLIERHVHIRRRFGTKFLHRREFDRYERNPEKANALVVKRAQLPKRSMGTYESTELDTTEKRIPWYYPAFGIGVPLVIGAVFWITGRVGGQLSGRNQTQVTAQAAPTDPHGALATGGEGGEAVKVNDRDDYLKLMSPRVASQPWTAPAFDGLTVPNQPPRIFCMSTGKQFRDTWQVDSCTCLTEQGTKYKLDPQVCALIARDGQYEPYLDEVEGDRRRLDDATQLKRMAETKEASEREASSSLTPGAVKPFATWSNYGGLGMGVSAANGDASPGASQ